MFRLLDSHEQQLVLADDSSELIPSEHNATHLLPVVFPAPSQLTLQLYSGLHHPNHQPATHTRPQLLPQQQQL